MEMSNFLRGKMVGSNSVDSETLLDLRHVLLENASFKKKE